MSRRTNLEVYKASLLEQCPSIDDVSLIEINAHNLLITGLINNARGFEDVMHDEVASDQSRQKRLADLAGASGELNRFSEALDEISSDTASSLGKYATGAIQLYMRV